MRMPEIVSIRQFFDYYITREWKAPKLADDEIVATYEATVKAIEDLARNGKLTIWGKTDPNSGGATPIPARAWREVQVFRQSMFESAVHSEYRTQKELRPYPLYFMLAVDKNEVERVLPPIGWFGKLLRVFKK